MLSDRSYMRTEYPRQTTSALTWILCATIAGALMQWTFMQWGGNAFAQLMALSPSSLLGGRVWTLLSYAVLHDGPLHLLFNCLGLFFFGRELMPLLGNARFLRFYAGAILLGGLAWLGVALLGNGGALAGASAGVAALFILFACIYPEREITFLLLFVLPVTVKPKYLAWGLLAFDGIGLIFGELPNAIFPSGIAHSAHLGGMLAGWLYFRLVYARHGFDRASGGTLVEFPHWLRRRQEGAAHVSPASKVDLGRAPAASPAHLRAEVDRILDKINSHGFGALTEQEKKLLDDAKDLLSRR